MKAAMDGTLGQDSQLLLSYETGCVCADAMWITHGHIPTETRAP